MTARKIPVFKRSDFVKQFETLVQQEVAYHDKKIEEYRKEINEFRKRIEKMWDELETRLINQHDCHIIHKRDSDESFNHIYDELDQIRKENHKIREEQKRIRESQGKMICDFYQKCATQEDLENQKESVEKLFNTCKENREWIYENLIGLIHEKYKSAIHNINQLKDSMDDLPKTPEDLEGKLLSFMEDYKIDSKGVIELMNKHANRMFRLEKKFEYLYNQIDRIKDKI